MTWRRLGPVLTVLAACVAAKPASPMFQGFEVDGDSVLRPAAANGRLTAMPTIEAVPVNGAAPEVDGRLDDSAWGPAPAGTGFRIWDPNRGALPTEETVFKVVYDQEAVYFGVACLEHDPSRVSAKLSRRDRFSNSDLVSIYIDPYDDNNTGYNFKVNPLGVQMDSYLFNDGERDDDWDAVWQAETFRDDAGWYAEIRIPFSAVRYRKAQEMTWGLQVYRYMHGRGEDTAWVTWERETPGFISRFGELRGLRDVPAPRQLEVLPFTVARAIDRAITPDTPPPGSGAPGDVVDGHGNFGADLKYGVTEDLTLNAAFQPDFGQVEADPATLNLSPFETFFEEKRPFFVEGNKFFTFPGFELFYSRRVGTGDENSRIRFAGKLTGKVGGSTTVAALAAATDLAGEDQAHNPFKSGDLQNQYMVARVGRDLAGGRHRINLMGTAVHRSEDRREMLDRGVHPSAADFLSREAYTGGLDWDFTFRERAYRVSGALVGSIIDHADIAGDERSGRSDYGTGGRLQLSKQNGRWRSTLAGRWEHDRLNINDIGYLQAPDEMAVSAWVGYRIDAQEGKGLFNQGELNFNAYRSWLYAGRAGRDINTGEIAWAYNARHPQNFDGNVNTWLQWRNYWESWAGLELMPRSSQRYETRGGPLMDEPTTYGGWAGGSSDVRKDFRVNLEMNHFRDTEQSHSSNVTLGVNWNQNSHMSHSLSAGFRFRKDDTQYLETLPAAEVTGASGIGGLSYLFGDIRQKTVDVTLRSTLLFGRSTSLEVYAQPFVSVGEYRRVRELGRPDSYDLFPLPAVDPAEYDFSFGSVNVNSVLRWEYRPGSTLYLVWTHGRGRFDQRRFGNGAFRPDITFDPLFRNEPENSLLVKMSYWLPV